MVSETAVADFVRLLGKEQDREQGRQKKRRTEQIVLSSKVTVGS